MKRIKRLLLPILLIIAWTFFVAYGWMGSGFLLKSQVSGEESTDFIEFIKTDIDKTSVGNLAVRILENGEISGEFFYSIDQPVDQSTIFKMASVTKWVTTWGILDLVEEGKLDLDKPIESYLSSWKLPSSEFDHSGITTRRILTHTAGINDDYEFKHTTSPDSIETIYQYLSLTKVVYPPGTNYYYSNNGYAILQVLIEDITGLAFEEYMMKSVLDPLSIKSSRFSWYDTLELKLATSYNEDGSIGPHFYYADQSTGTLYTSIDEFTKFLQAHLGENPVLNKTSIELLTTNQSSEGFPMRGLGTQIYGRTKSNENIIGHGGLERWTVENQVLLNPNTGDGLIVFSNGTYDYAHNLGLEWLFWKYGIISYSTQMNNINRTVIILLVGYVVILSLFWLRRLQNKRKKSG